MSRPSLPGATLGVFILVIGSVLPATGARLPIVGPAYAVPVAYRPAGIEAAPLLDISLVAGDTDLRSAEAGEERPGHLGVLGLRLTGVRRWARNKERRSPDGPPAPRRVAQAEGGGLEPLPALKGLLIFEAGSARFTDCRSGRAYPLAEGGDFEALEHAYLAAGREPGGPLMVSFEGSIDDMPSLDENGDEPTVMVERFVGVWPDQTCDQALGDATLKGTEWAIRRLARTDLPVEAEDSWLLLDDEEDRFSATVGCNQLVGAFDQKDTRLRFGPAAATMMACPEPVDAWEAALSEVLNETNSYRIVGTSLEFLDRDGHAIAAFEARYYY